LDLPSILSIRAINKKSRAVMLLSLKLSFNSNFAVGNRGK